jgi:DNA-binding IscR family transcriptional regulator
MEGRWYLPNFLAVKITRKILVLIVRSTMEIFSIRIISQLTGKFSPLGSKNLMPKISIKLSKNTFVGSFAGHVGTYALTWRLCENVRDLLFLTA